MRWTKAQMDNYLQLRRAMDAEARPDDDPEVPDVGPESKLQAKCLTYCKDRGYLVYHDWSRKRNTAGWPDMFCFLPKSRLILVELKAAGGKLRAEQQALKRQLMYLGFKVYVVKSYKRFVEILKGE